MCVIGCAVLGNSACSLANTQRRFCVYDDTGTDCIDGFVIIASASSHNRTPGYAGTASNCPWFSCNTRQSSQRTVMPDCAREAASVDLQTPLDPAKAHTP